MISFLPEAVSPFTASLLTIASFFTSALTASIGIGGGLMMLALLAYVLPPLVLIPFHGVIQLGSNASRAFVQRSDISWTVVLPFLGGALIGAALGAAVAIRLPIEWLRILLGAFILFVVWIKLPPLPSTDTAVSFSGGLVTTFISMFVGATGPLAAVFLSRFFKDRKTLVASHGAAMSFQHGFKVLAFMAAGFAFFNWVPLMIAMICSGYLGTLAGTRLLQRLPEELFKKLFKGALTLVALDLVRRGVMA